MCTVIQYFVRFFCGVSYFLKLGSVYVASKVALFSPCRGGKHAEDEAAS